MEEQLSKDDQQRVNNCDHYLKTKQVMKNAETYKNLQVGEVYYIKYKDYNDKEAYISSGWGNDPAKFMVFHKDGGFVFVKRIIASGELGKEVICLTTHYDVDSHWLEADPDYVNSILLENEEGYDPMAASKQMASKKNKARRRNKKIEVSCETHEEAYEFIKTLKKGDTLYDSDTAYGSGIVKWRVKKVTKRPTNKDNPKNAYYGRTQGMVGSTYEDQIHNKHNFDQLILVEIEPLDTNTRRYIGGDRSLTFDNFHKSHYTKYYQRKPYTVDDV